MFTEKHAAVAYLASYLSVTVQQHPFGLQGFHAANLRTSDTSQRPEMKITQI